jgi:hypothetical protein
LAVARIKVTRRLGCFTGVIVIALVITLAPIQGLSWDASFEDAEYQFTFIDEMGRPVPDVTLRMESPSGGVCYFCPVNEFLPDQAPTSDLDGRMAFHHIYEIVEYGGSDYCNLLGF